MTGTAVSAPFQVLFICTGNICRSPLAERLLRARLQQAGPAVAARYQVHSAGVGALVDRPMDEQAAAALAERGGDPAGFAARQVSDALLREAGLVLTAGQQHRARVLRDQPTAMRRTFTLREFAALCGSLDDEAGVSGPGDLVRQAAARRGSTQVADYDIPDPYRRTDEDHALAAGLIQEAIDTIAPALVRAAEVSQ